MMLVVWKKHPIYIWLPEHALALSLVTATSLETLNIYAWLKVHIVIFQVLPIGKKTAFRLFSSISTVTNKQLMNIFQKKNLLITFSFKLISWAWVISCLSHLIVTLWLSLFTKSWAFKKTGGGHKKIENKK